MHLARRRCYRTTTQTGFDTFYHFICVEVHLFFCYGGSYEGNLHPNLVLQFVCIFQAVLLCECWSVKILIRIRSAVVDSITPELFFDTKLVLGYTESNRHFKAVYIF